MDYIQKYQKYKNKFLELTQTNLENTTNKFVQSLKGSKPISQQSPTEARNTLNQLQKDDSYKEWVMIETVDITIANEKIAIDPFEYDIKDVTIRTKIFRPKDSLGILPVIMYYHGGGWVLGNSGTHGRLVSEIAVGTNSAVVFVEYTPAPDAKYPTQLVESYLATKYIINNGNKHNLDPKKLVVMGDSVGGNITIVMTILAKKYHTFHIAYQVLLYPVTDARMDSESYKQFANGPWLTKDSMDWFNNALLAIDTDRSQWPISPLLLPTKELAGLPPALIITDENDVLRDEGELYAHKLMNAGVDVTAVRYLGTIHDFLMLDPLKNTPAVRSAIKLIIAHVKEIFTN